MMRIKDIIKNNLLAISAMFLLLLIFFGKFFLFGESRFPNPLHHDAVWFNLPLYAYLKNSFNNGELPLWNPYILSGNPDYHIASTIALSTLLLPLSVIPDINMVIVFSIVLTGMYIFLAETIQVNKTAALIGALTFTFSGFFVVWLHQTYTIGGLVFLPWNFYLLNKAISKKSIPFAIAAGISISLALVNGVPQMFIYAIMAITAFFLFRTLPILKRDRNEALILSLLFFLLLGIGFCLSGIYLFPFLELLQSSHRPNLTYAQVINTESTWGAQPLKNLITYIIPDFFGNGLDWNLIPGTSIPDKISYIGIFPFMLAVIALFSERNRYTYFFFGVAVFSLLMALGSPLYAIFYYGLPILAKARAIARINILINFSVAVLAAIGVHNLLEGKIKKKTVLLICWGFLLIFAAGYFIYYDNILDKPKHQYLLQFIIWITALFAIGLYGLRCMQTDRGESHWSERLFLSLCVCAVFFALAMTVYYEVFQNMHAKIDYSITIKYNPKYDAYGSKYGIYRSLMEKSPSQWYLLYAPLITVISIVLASKYFFRKREGASKIIFSVFFIGLAAFDLMGYGARLNPYINKEETIKINIESANEYGKLNPYVDKKGAMFSKTPGILFLQKDNELYRILPFSRSNRAIMPGNTAAPYGIQNVSGYEGVYSKWYNRLASEVDLRSPIETPIETDAVEGKSFGNFVTITNLNSPILDMLNVKYVVTDEKLDMPGWSSNYYDHIKNLVPVYFGDDMLIYRNKNYMQRAFLVPEVKVENDGEKIIKELFSDTFDPRRYAIVETKKDSIYSFPPSDPVLLKESSLTLEGYKNNSVSLKAEMKDQGFLVLADNYYPGWKVFVDGKEQTLYKTNYALRGVHLEKGKHLIKFVYDPLSFKIGMYLSFSTLFGIMAYFVWHLKTASHRDH